MVAQWRCRRIRPHLRGPVRECQLRMECRHASPSTMNLRRALQDQLWVHRSRRQCKLSGFNHQMQLTRRWCQLTACVCTASWYPREALVRWTRRLVLDERPWFPAAYRNSPSSRCIVWQVTICNDCARRQVNQAVCFPKISINGEWVDER